MNEREQDEFREMKNAVDCLARGLLVTHRQVVNLTSLLNQACAEANAIEESLTGLVSHAMIRHGINSVLDDRDPPDQDELRPHVLDLVGSMIEAMTPYIVAQGRTPQELIEDLILKASKAADRARAANVDDAEGLWQVASDRYEIAKLITRDPAQKELFAQQSKECHQRMLEARVNRSSRN